MDDMDGTLTRLYSVYASEHSGPADWHGEARMARRAVIPQLRSWLGRKSDLRVLDVGCGQGAIVQALIDEGYLAAQGVDRSPEQVDLAHRRGVRAVTLGDYSGKLRERWDVVLAFDFVEHLAPSAVLPFFDQVLAALNPGGILIARMPNAVSPFAGLYQHGDFTHRTVMSPRSFGQVARAAGFDSVKCQASNPVVHGPKSALRAILWAMISLGLKASVAAETGHTKVIVSTNFLGIARKAAAE
ncbi:MAG TPA: class I SAM-dependent methyltransferase [Mycobacteriales bacterium]|nr:class I SAM-dependent methyltransferase [Mycobacteriales bacterium]